MPCIVLTTRGNQFLNTEIHNSWAHEALVWTKMETYTFVLFSIKRCTFQLQTGIKINCVSTGKLLNPRAICFDETGERFWTNGTDLNNREILHVFYLQN